MKKILISGAGIAGPVLAFWLHKSGWQTTIVERGRELRLGGQNIDIKGAAREVAEKMELYEAIRDQNTGEAGTQYVDKDNEVVASFEKGQLGGLTSELEIVRGDLVQLLYDQTRENTEYRFGDWIEGLEDQGDSVEVNFHSGKTESYDLVVGADGQSSRTRELVFGDEPELKYLGLYTSYLTVPKGPNDTNWARWYISTKSRSIIVRPDNEGNSRVAFNFLSPDRDYGRLPKEEQKKLLVEVFDDAGWETDRLLDGLMKADDLYLDAVTQVRMKKWWKGRVVLVGDAAYCPTPVSGKGTALAMIGAYMLAQELRLQADHTAAFNAFEEKLRPYVESTQKFPAGFIRLFYPSSELGVYWVNKLEAVVASKTFQTIAGLFTSEKSDEDDFQLPDYAEENR